MKNELTGRWVTLKGGRRVFIKDGQTLNDAINDYDKSLNRKLEKLDKKLEKANGLKKIKKELLNDAYESEQKNDYNRASVYNERQSMREYTNATNRVNDLEYEKMLTKKEQDNFRKYIIDNTKEITKMNDELKGKQQALKDNKKLAEHKLNEVKHTLAYEDLDKVSQQELTHKKEKIENQIDDYLKEIGVK